MRGKEIELTIQPHVRGMIALILHCIAPHWRTLRQSEDDFTASFPLTYIYGISLRQFRQPKMANDGQDVDRLKQYIADIIETLFKPHLDDLTKKHNEVRKKFDDALERNRNLQDELTTSKKKSDDFIVDLKKNYSMEILDLQNKLKSASQRERSLLDRLAKFHDASCNSEQKACQTDRIPEPESPDIITIESDSD